MRMREDKLQRNNSKTMSEVQSALARLCIVPREKVERWFSSTDIEVLGAVADLVTYPPHSELVDPPLAEEQLVRLLFPYYERCLREDPDGEWAASRYGIAHEMVGWFGAVPMEENVFSQTFLVQMKDWLGALYREADEELRTAIVTGALEHILEEPRWRDFFAEWRDDAVLRQAYDEAMTWAVEHER